MIRGQWFAVGCDLDGSPPMARLRARLGSLADAYFYRALGWVMKYRQHGRVLDEDWPVLSEAIRWPESPEELRDVMLAVGLVDAVGRAFSWEMYNGWILAKYERDRRRHRNKVKAGRASAARRREHARGRGVRGRV